MYTVGQIICFIYRLYKLILLKRDPPRSRVHVLQP